MYPHEELRRLAAHKAALRRDIAVHRAQCATAVARLAQPVEWFDRVLATWRRLAPVVQIVAVPLTLLAARTVFPRLKFLVPLLRWAPIAVSVAGGLGSVFQSRPRSPRR
jgi:hypothetical protein